MRAWLWNLWEDAWCLLRCGKTRRGRLRAFAQAASDALGDRDHTIITYDSLDRIEIYVNLNEPAESISLDLRGEQDG